MKKLLGVAVILILALGLYGCPATTGNFVVDTRNQLEIYDLVEGGLYTGVSSLCLAGEIPMNACAIATASDAAWGVAYEAAKVALTQYEGGKITKEQAQALVAQAVKIYLQVKADLKTQNRAPLEKKMGEKGIKPKVPKSK
jgi:hypothetical protein